MKKLSTLNSQLSTSKGFTLIELLVVMGVLFAVSAIVSAILFSTLRGSEKTVTLDTVRQNGNYALSVMAKQIRNAKKLDFPTNCLSPTPTPVPVLRITSQDRDQQITYLCCYGPNNPLPSCTGTESTIISEEGSLLDTTRVSLVSDSCSFTCTQPSQYQPPTIKIKFNLTQSGTPPFPEHQAAVNFETSVTLRNPPAQ